MTTRKKFKITDTGYARYSFQTFLLNTKTDNKRQPEHYRNLFIAKINDKMVIVEWL